MIMKKNYIIPLLCLVIVLISGGFIYYFWQSNSQNALPTVSESVKNTPETVAPSQNPSQNQINFTPSPQNQMQVLTPKMQAFVDKIEGLLKGTGTRESKIISLLDILRNSQSDEEKIATLQSLALLKPIENIDEIMAIAKSNKESEKVRAEAIKTLSDSYSLTDEEVQKIGGSTVYVQMEKISQYVESVVKDKETPPEVYNTALQSYAFMKPEEALPLAKNIVSKPSAMTEAESNFFNSTMFANNQNLVSLLPVIQQNPEKITDKMASQIAVMTADPTILKQLNKSEKEQVINVLKNHKLDQSSPMYQIELDTINAKVQEIENSLK